MVSLRRSDGEEEEEEVKRAQERNKFSGRKKKKISFYGNPATSTLSPLPTKPDPVVCYVHGGSSSVFCGQFLYFLWHSLQIFLLFHSLPSFASFLLFSGRHLSCLRHASRTFRSPPIPCGANHIPVFNSTPMAIPYCTLSALFPRPVSPYSSVSLQTTDPIYYQDLWHMVAMCATPIVI